MMEKHVVTTFPTLLLESTDPEFDCQQDLTNWIYNLREKDTDGVTVSNRGGWQSSDAYFYRNDKTFRPFIEYISKRIEHLMSDVFQNPVGLINMWANINPPGTYNIEHDHAQCDMSGVLWIQGPENSGNFVLKNPNGFVQFPVIGALAQDVQQLTSHVVIHAPTPGKMMLFPSHIRHLVETNQSQQDRISIAFNLTFV